MQCNNTLNAGHYLEEGNVLVSQNGYFALHVSFDHVEVRSRIPEVQGTLWSLGFRDFKIMPMTYRRCALGVGAEDGRLHFYGIDDKDKCFSLWSSSAACKTENLRLELLNNGQLALLNSDTMDLKHWWTPAIMTDKRIKEHKDLEEILADCRKKLRKLVPSPNPSNKPATRRDIKEVVECLQRQYRAMDSLRRLRDAFNQLLKSRLRYGASKVHLGL